jgi:hypothetical protein
MSERSIPRLIAALMAALCASTAAAAERAPASTLIEARPVTHSRDGRIHGCGLRLTGGEPAVPASSWFDVSVNLFRRGIGLAQSIAYEIRRSEYDGESRPARVPVRSTWVKASYGSARLGESLERADALVYTLLADDVLAVFEAVATAQPVTLGIQRWNDRTDAVYTGTPVISGDSRTAMTTCLAALLE